MSTINFLISPYDENTFSRSNFGPSLSRRSFSVLVYAIPEAALLYFSEEELANPGYVSLYT